MEEASSVSLVPFLVSEKGDLDICFLCPLWPDSHGKGTENKSQKGAASLMLFITGPSLQNTQQTAVTPHLDHLKITLCAARAL